MLRTNTSLHLRKHTDVGVDERKPPHERNIRNLNPKSIELNVHMSTTTTHNISICHLEQGANIATFKTYNKLTRQKVGWCNLWCRIQTNVLDKGLLVFKKVVRIVHAIEVGGSHWRGGSAILWAVSNEQWAMSGNLWAVRKLKILVIGPPISYNRGILA